MSALEHQERCASDVPEEVDLDVGGQLLPRHISRHLPHHKVVGCQLLHGMAKSSQLH